MVSASTGEITLRSPKKRPLSNGYNSLISGNMVKYKVRQVSAVRDFPLQCGPNARTIEPKPEENDNMLAGVAKIDVVKTDDVNVVKHIDIHENGGVQSFEGNFESQYHNDGKSPLEVESDVLLNNLEKIVATATHEVLPVGNKSIIHCSDDLVNKPSGFLKGENVHVKPVLTKEQEKARHWTVDENVAMKEVTVVCGDDAAVAGVVPVSCIELDLPAKWPASSSGLKKESPVSKNKYRQRRVSAVREFPPFCGKHAPVPTGREPVVAIDASQTVEKNVTGAIMEGRDIGPEGTSLDSCMDWGNSKQIPEDGLQGRAVRRIMRDGVDESEKSLNNGLLEKNEVEGTLSVLGNVPKSEYDNAGGSLSMDIVLYTQDEKKEIVPRRSEMICKRLTKTKNEDDGRVVKNEIVVHALHENDLRSSVGDICCLGGEANRVIVYGLMAESCCPWRQGKKHGSNSVGGNASWQKRPKAVAKKSTPKTEISKGRSKQNKLLIVGKYTPSKLIPREGQAYIARHEEQDEGSSGGHLRLDLGVQLPPFGPNSSVAGDSRNRVRETLRLFQTLCRKLLHGEEAKSTSEENSKSKDKSSNRIDLNAAKIIKDKGKEVNTEKQIVGAVPGVEVGDEFQYRVELAIIGVHRLYQAGIDYLKDEKIAISIVASGAYADDMDNPDELIYSGQGGNMIGKNKQPEDQKLEKGNYALFNSISVKNPVRVIRGSKETKASDSSDARSKIVTTYVYDGLYTVVNSWPETGPHGNLVYMFKLIRNPGQPELFWKEVKSRKLKVRHGVCFNDISGGKESLPICAVNTLDDEKPPPFTYINKMMYPDWFHPKPPKGCDCAGKCLDSRKCICALKNGGEIPYNRNGAIVEAKPLVYECGPSCKCPPSCYNRVTQLGIKIHLEIFKTQSRGWGVRSLTSIPSGSFICEYAGELLEDKEAEERTGNDEYLFDIGQNYTDYSLNPGGPVDASEVMEDTGFTIDAAKYGNVGRFINHSCSPNLYAQNVLYDHEEKGMPHIMLFAAENIPPLKELTYHYNYMIDQVRDSNGNIKKKSCYCGSAECTGRMY